MNVEICEEVGVAGQSQSRQSDAAWVSKDSWDHHRAERAIVDSIELDDEQPSVEAGTVSNQEKADILECFVAHCPRSTHRPLGFLETDKNVYTVPNDTAEVERAMRDNFSLASLANCGLFVAGVDGAVGLAPALTNQSSFILLKDAATEMPYELITPTGCLYPRALPALEIVYDSYTQRLIEERNHDLIVASTIEDVLLLRACRIPATLATGLEEVPVEHVDQFCEAFDLLTFEDRAKKMAKSYSQARNNSSPRELYATEPHCRGTQKKDEVKAAGAVNTATDPEPDPDELRAEPLEVRLSMLLFPLSQLTIATPWKVKPVVDHIFKLHKMMDIDISEIGLWEPESKTMERLRFFAERRDAKRLRNVLVESVAKISSSIFAFGKEQPVPIGPPADYATAVARFYKSLRAEEGLRLPSLPSQKPRNKEWPDVRRLLESQVVGPLRKMAVATRDPMKSSLLSGYAELSRAFHIQSILMNVQLDRRIAKHGAEDGGQPPEERFKKLMAMADRLLEMKRAIERCK